MSGHGQLKLKQKMAPRVREKKAKIIKGKKIQKRRGKRGGKDNMKQLHHGQQADD